MPEETNLFRDWLDARKLSAKQAAELFGVEAQTIAHWRSQGVPERRRLHVDAVIAGYNPEQKTPQTLDTSITIFPTWEQIARWQRAAAEEGKSPDRWVIDGLDEMAREAFPDNSESSLRVAEDGDNYDKKS